MIVRDDDMWPNPRDRILARVFSPYIGEPRDVNTSTSRVSMILSAERRRDVDAHHNISVTSHEVTKDLRRRTLLMEYLHYLATTSQVFSSKIKNIPRFNLLENFSDFFFLLKILSFPNTSTIIFLHLLSLLVLRLTFIILPLSHFPSPHYPLHSPKLCTILQSFQPSLPSTTPHYSLALSITNFLSYLLPFFWPLILLPSTFTPLFLSSQPLFLSHFPSIHNPSNSTFLLLPSWPIDLSHHHLPFLPTPLLITTSHHLFPSRQAFLHPSHHLTTYQVLPLLSLFLIIPSPTPSP